LILAIRLLVGFFGLGSGGEVFLFPTLKLLKNTSLKEKSEKFLEGRKRERNLKI